ncbi:hypothetical protein IVA96_23885 [Bradyrhizobium sp. 159]|uniref:hypothetical protein n=1 Tax=Bradyrhizobium sp. 159 TaxID=2782632 RepID=UPI001FF8C337|nr:hypothetical protein [Bradyrhizobium sp. 159]MCK1619560.1 hypothetical protein [Bradyrhizobium sp. 159]
MNDRYFDHLTNSTADIGDIHVRAAAARITNVHRAILAAIAANIGDRDLTPTGKQKKGRDELKQKAPDLVKINALVQRLAARTDEKRAAVQLPAIDKTDTAGAVLRGQVRDRLAGKSPQELRALIPTMSALYLQTILEAPELIGADRETVDAARARVIDVVRPGMSAELERERVAVNLLVNAAAALSTDARELADLPTANALDAFIAEAVPNPSGIVAEIARDTAIAA